MRRIPGLLALSLTVTWVAAGPGLVRAQTGTGTGVDLMDVDLMFIGAHPDDDTGVLGTLARYLLDEGYKGTVITLTGGEGGGNAIGRESGPSLGLIRQEEERRSLAMVGVVAALCVLAYSESRDGGVEIVAGNRKVLALPDRGWARASQNRPTRGVVGRLVKNAASLAGAFLTRRLAA